MVNGRHLNCNYSCHPCAHTHTFFLSANTKYSYYAPQYNRRQYWRQYWRLTMLIINAFLPELFVSPKRINTHIKVQGSAARLVVGLGQFYFPMWVCVVLMMQDDVGLFDVMLSVKNPERVFRRRLGRQRHTLTFDLLIIVWLYFRCDTPTCWLVHAAVINIKMVHNCTQ